MVYKQYSRDGEGETFEGEWFVAEPGSSKPFFRRKMIHIQYSSNGEGESFVVESSSMEANFMMMNQV